MSNLVHNERVKLFATFLNNIAVASVAVGAHLQVKTPPRFPLKGIRKSPFSYVPYGT